MPPLYNQEKFRKDIITLLKTEPEIFSNEQIIKYSQVTYPLIAKAFKKEAKKRELNLT